MKKEILGTLNNLKHKNFNYIIYTSHMYVHDITIAESKLNIV